MLIVRLLARWHIASVRTQHLPPTLPLSLTFFIWRSTGAANHQWYQCAQSGPWDPSTNSPSQRSNWFVVSQRTLLPYTPKWLILIDFHQIFQHISRYCHITCSNFNEYSAIEVSTFQSFFQWERLGFNQWFEHFNGTKCGYLCPGQNKRVAVFYPFLPTSYWLLAVF